MPNLYEYHLFRDYTKAIKEFCQNSVYLSRFPNDNNWQVFFETLDQAYAKRIIPMINGKNISPNGIISLDSTEYIDNENLGGFYSELIKGNDLKYDSIRNPLIYRLEYTLTFFTSIRADADIINYQLLTKAPKNRKHTEIINENWCEIYVHSPTNETALEPEEAKSKVHRNSLKITIPRAFINYPIQREGISEISEISATIEAVESDDLYI